MCKSCGKIDKCGCCEASPCNKCLDCFPLEYDVVRNPVVEDKCDSILDKFKGRPNKGRCDMSINVVVDGQTVAIHAISNVDPNARIEYSNNGVAFGVSNLFTEQPCGAHTYYARIVGNEGCMVNQRAIVTAGCQECVPEWINFNPIQKQCREDGFEYYLQYNTCDSTQRWFKSNIPCQHCSKEFKPYVPTQTKCEGGKVQRMEMNECKEVRWVATDENCSPCHEEWYIVPSVPTRCISGFVNVFEANTCGGVRWRATSDRCSDCGGWRPDLPSQQECRNNTIWIKEINDCGETRFSDTKIPCGQVVTPCSPSVTLTGVPSQVCSSDIISIDGSGLTVQGGSGTYRWAIVKTSDFTGVENLAWGNTRVWSVTDYTTPFRIYVSAVGGNLESTSCYAHVDFLTIQCGGGGGMPVCPQNFILSSVTSTNTGATLTFSGFSGVSGVLWRLKTPSGLVIKNGSASISTNTVNITYPSGAVGAGSYLMEVEASSCQSAVTSLPVTISGSVDVETEDPSVIGLLKFGLSYNSGNHDTTIGLNGSTANYQVQIKSVNAPSPASGKTWNGTTDEAPFNEFTWLINDTRWPHSDYGGIYRANAVESGVDGLVAGYKYKFIIKNPNIPGFVFVKEVTMPTNSTNGYMDIPISSDSGVCKQGPTLITILSSTQTVITYQFDGQEVYSIRNRIKQGSTVIYNIVTNPTSSTVVVNLPLPLSAGNYTLEIEGNSCTSSVSSLPFIVTNGGGGIIEPVIQPSEDGVFVTTRGTETYYMNHGLNTIMKVTNRGTVRVEQQNGSPIPKTKTATNGTANLVILRNEKTLTPEEVDKFIGPEGLVLVEDNLTTFTFLWGTVLTREALDTRTHVPWESWSTRDGHSAPYFAGGNEFCQVSFHKS